MNPSNPLRRRIGISFSLMSMTLLLQIAAAVPSAIITLFLPQNYATAFLLPQITYPLLCILLTGFVMRQTGIPLHRQIRIQPPKARILFPWAGVFLMTAVVMNFLVNGFVAFLERHGTVLPDLFQSYAPQTWVQAVFYFIAVAILPPLSEEFLCRAALAGSLKDASPKAAVLVSAFAFGLMHATLQQIPFAFALGLVLAAVYIRTGNLLYPILLHFLNNFWACFLTFLEIFFGASAAGWIQTFGNILFVLWGIGSFLYLSVHHGFRLPKPSSVYAEPRVGKSLFTSLPFWIFTLLYTALTVLNLIL